MFEAVSNAGRLDEFPTCVCCIIFVGGFGVMRYCDPATVLKSLGGLTLDADRAYRCGHAP